MVLPFVNLIFAGPSLIPLPQIFPADKHNAVGVLCALIGLLFLAKNMFYVLAQRARVTLESSISSDLRAELLMRVLGLDYSYFLTAERGILASRILSTSHRIARNRSMISFNLAKCLPLLVGYVGILLWLNWSLLIVCLMLIPVISWVQGFSGRLVERLTRGEERASGELLQRIQQILQNIKLVKLLNRESAEADWVQRHSSSWLGLLKKKSVTEALFVAAMEMLGVSIGIFLLYYIGHQTIDGSFSFGPGGFVLFIAAVFSTIDPARELFRVFQLKIETKQLGESLNAYPFERKQGRTRLDAFSDSLILKEVTFAYGSTMPPILEDFSGILRPGDHLAVLGDSGIGKSTLFDLLTGLLTPTSGVILLDSIPVHEICPQSRVRLFGVINQETFLFQDSVRNNLCVGVERSDLALIQALNQAGLQAWFESQPLGLDTLLGDQGQTLSGGEKQRLSIARLLLRNPEIILLDEPTSALDEATEIQVLSVIFTVFRSKTILAISHRPAILGFVDKSWFLGKKGDPDLSFQDDFAILNFRDREILR